MENRHTKYKNTGILLELLIKQAASDTINKVDKLGAMDLIKKYIFTNEIFKEYKVINNLNVKNGLSEKEATELLEMSVEMYKKIDKKKLNREKYNLIKEIKSSYNLDDFVKIKIPNYKKLASIYVLLESADPSKFTNPDLLLRCKNEILGSLTKKEEKENPVVLSEAKVNPIKSIKNEFVNLNKNQKKLFKEYLMCLSKPESFKKYFNECVVVVKNELSSLSEKVEDVPVKVKLQEVLKYVVPVGGNKSVKDEDLVMIMDCYSLIDELSKIKH